MLKEEFLESRKHLATCKWVPSAELDQFLASALPGQTLHTLEMTGDFDEALADWEYADALHEIIASHSGVTYFPVHALDHYSLVILHGNETPPHCIIINSLPAPRCPVNVQLLQDYLTETFPPDSGEANLKIDYTCQAAQDPRFPNGCASFVYFNAVNYNELYLQGCPNILQVLQERARELARGQYPPLGEKS